ncbi:MAG: adenosylhomocysteinase [Pseudonocardiaceae bacterium]
MDSVTQGRLRRFFDKVCTLYCGGNDAASIVITHLLEDRPYFLDAVSSLAPIMLVLPKPRSIHFGTRSRVSEVYKIAQLNRRKLHESESALQLLEQYAPGKPLVLLDMGGYFAPLLQDLEDNYSGRLVGVVEDTENGLQKYERLSALAVPVFSVARSPLKNPEDYLVGQSIMFSTEALLRERGDILQGRKACVIGYGKLGRSIAQVLRSKNVRTVIFDTNPVTLVEALSHGFEITRNLRVALSGSQLILCATGNISLKGEDFTRVCNGAYIATVTSSDDELDLVGLRSYYHEQRLDDCCTRYSTAGHYFYLLNKGNAVNFVHGAAVGSFIQLVQAEILVCVSKLLAVHHRPGFHTVDAIDRSAIAATWLEYFHND